MITLLIYFSGYIVSYILFRIMVGKPYILRDRVFGLIFSLGSWITVLAFIWVFVGKALEKIRIDWTKEVKW